MKWPWPVVMARTDWRQIKLPCAYAPLYEGTWFSVGKAPLTLTLAIDASAALPPVPTESDGPHSRWARSRAGNTAPLPRSWRSHDTTEWNESAAFRNRSCCLNQQDIRLSNAVTRLITAQQRWPHPERQIAGRLNCLRRLLIIVGPQYGIYDMPPFRRLQFEVAPSFLKNAYSKECLCSASVRTQQHIQQNSSYPAAGYPDRLGPSGKHFVTVTVERLTIA